jgi:uncharacterized membrane protein
MTEPIHMEPEVLEPSDDSLKTVSLISYVLHLIVAVSAVVPGAQVGPVLLIVALILDMVKKPDAEGTWQASHFKYRIRTVLWAAVGYTVTLPLWFLFVFPGWLAWTAISVWFLYRIVSGMMRWNRAQAMTE